MSQTLLTNRKQEKMRLRDATNIIRPSGLSNRRKYFYFYIKTREAPKKLRTSRVSYLGLDLSIFDELKTILWPSPFKGCEMLTRGRRMCSSRPACSCAPSRTPQRPPWSTPPQWGWGRGVPEQRAQTPLHTPYFCIDSFREQKEIDSLESHNIWITGKRKYCSIL